MARYRLGDSPGVNLSAAARRRRQQQNPPGNQSRGPTVTRGRQQAAREAAQRNAARDQQRRNARAALAGGPRRRQVSPDALSPPNTGFRDSVNAGRRVYRPGVTSGPDVPAAARSAKRGARTAARVAAQSTRNTAPTGNRATRRGTTSGGSSGGGRSGGGGGRSGKPAKPAKPSKPSKPNRNTPATAATPDTPETEEEDAITAIFDAARRDLDRRGLLNTAIREAEMAGQRDYDEFMAGKRKESQDWLAQQWANSQQNMAAAHQEAQAIGEQATNAAAQSGGSQDLMNIAGANANAASQRVIDQNEATVGGDVASQQAALARYTDSQSAGDRARTANLIAQINARHGAEASEIEGARGKLVSEELKARMDQEAANRQFGLEQEAAQFMRNLQQSQLGVQQYNAETDRLKVKTQAEAAARADQLRLAIANGQMSQRQAELQFKQALAQSNLSEKQKDRQLKRWQTLQRSGASSQTNLVKARDAAQTRLDSILKAYGVPDMMSITGTDGTGKDDGGGTARRDITRQLARHIKSAYPKMTVAQAQAILGGLGVPSQTLRDPDIVKYMLANFKGA